MDESITYWDLERNCPKDCPFLRKLKDKHIYLCVEYRLFLEKTQRRLKMISDTLLIKAEHRAQKHSQFFNYSLPYR